MTPVSEMLSLAFHMNLEVVAKGQVVSRYEYNYEGGPDSAALMLATMAAVHFASSVEIATLAKKAAKKAAAATDEEEVPKKKKKKKQEPEAE